MAEEREDTTTLTDLSEAWDKAEEAVEEVEDEQVEEPEEPETIAAAAEEEPEEAPEEEPPVEGEEPAPEVETAAEEDSSGPPVGLPPEAREVWKDTPKAMQEALVKRERDFSEGIKKYAEGAKRAEMQDQALAPFQQYLQMNGGPSHIGELLQMGAMLQMGSPVQKAQLVAQIIQQRGVDVGTLDNMLVGNQPSPEVQQQGNVQQAVQEAMAPYQQFIGGLQQQQQQQQQQGQQRVQSEVEAFSTDPGNEFYNDVSGDMAMLMDVAANNGQNMSMQEAYDKACRMNDSISTIMSSRASAAEVAQKRAAAVSVSGSPSGPRTSAAPTSLRETLEQAYDSVGRV